MSTATAPVLVTGATGKQGGATARALREAGIPVRALVRDPTTDRARAVETRGIELVTADLEDRDSVIRAAEGARAVFSVQMPAITAEGVDFDREVAQGINLIEAALTAGVPQFVHTSVANAGRHTETPGWSDERWPTMTASYGAKSTIQDRLRTAGFPRWTLLKPGFFMENFLPSMAFLFPRGIEGGLVSLLKPETRLDLVAVDDIGRAAAAAVANPERFDRVELELVSEYRSMTEIAEVLSRELGTNLSAPDMTMDEALAAGMPSYTAAHDFLNISHKPGRPQDAVDLGIAVTSFETWAREHLRADGRPAGS